MMGMTVEIQNLETKDSQNYKIVWTTETDILAETPTISNESPIGKSILGKKKGDTVKVKAKGGTFEYKILGVK